MGGSRPADAARRTQAPAPRPAGRLDDGAIGEAPERRIGFPVAGRRWLAIIPAAFCALVMLLGLTGLIGIISPHRQRLDILDYEVEVWWDAPLAFVALGGLGLVATVLGVGARFEIRETATSLVFIKRLFGRRWRVTEMPKPAIIVIENRLDPLRVRSGRHELLVRAPGRVVRLPEGGPSNADLVWLEQALLAMR